jgi:hypothetical protein
MAHGGQLVGQLIVTLGDLGARFEDGSLSERFGGWSCSPPPAGWSCR